jgi:HEAT repeat protein
MGVANAWKAITSASWPTTAGKIIQSKVWQEADSRGDKTTRVSIVYLFTVQGKSYTGDNLWFGPFRGAEENVRRYRAGRQVRVHYDPANPQVAVLEAGFGLRNILELLLGLAILVIGLALGRFALRALPRRQFRTVRLRSVKRRARSTRPAQENGPETAPPSPAPMEPEATPNPQAPRQRTPPTGLLVRGEQWKNTAADPQDLAPRAKPEPATTAARLMEQLRHNDATVRRSAAEGLERLGPAAREAVPDLVVALVDVVKEVRVAAKQALAAVDPSWPSHEQIGRALPALAKELGNSRFELGQTAAEILSRIGLPALATLIQELLDAKTTESAHIRQMWLARALGWLGPSAQAAVPALVQALSSEHSHVREAAAEALEKIGAAAQDAVPALTAALEHWNKAIRRAAARALGCIGAGAASAASSLAKLLADQDVEVRAAAAEALAQLGTAAAPVLWQVYEDPLEAVQQAKERALKEMPERAIGVFWQELESRERTIRQVASLLNRIEAQNPGAAPSPLGVEREAATARVLQAKENALAEIADKVVPALVTLLSNEQWKVRCSAAEALGQAGPLAQTAVPALDKALKDVRMEVRAAALDALQRINQALSSVDPSCLGRP